MEKKIIFSENFVWGAATSAYQIEGAVKEDGKGEHIWDVYTKEPGLVYSGHTGEVACNHIILYQNHIINTYQVRENKYNEIIQHSKAL